MKIYEVHYDNCEPYEDHYEYADRFYSTYESAEKYLNGEGLIKRVESRFDWKSKQWVDVAIWEYPRYVCEMNNIDCYDCERYWDSDTYNGMTWVENGDGHSEVTDECPEIWARDSNAYYNPQWTIIEREVLD